MEPTAPTAHPTTLTRRHAVLLAATAVAACSSRRPASAVRAARAAAVERPLPAPATTGSVPLEHALARRRSQRRFDTTPLADAVTGQLMWAAQGITHDGDRRTAPSAGALYPLRLYAVTHDAVQEYLPDGHRVRRWSAAGALTELARATPSADALGTAPVVMVLTGTSATTASKYGRAADRYVYLEAGHAAQNLVLQATALDLAAVTIGALDPDRVAAALALPDGEDARYLIPVGRPG
jgi:SagB-type dehydrogenase family enzyme